MKDLALRQFPNFSGLLIVDIYVHQVETFVIEIVIFPLMVDVTVRSKAKKKKNP